MHSATKHRVPPLIAFPLLVVAYLIENWWYGFFKLGGEILSDLGIFVLLIQFGIHTAVTYIVLGYSHKPNMNYVLVMGLLTFVVGGIIATVLVVMSYGWMVFW